MVLSGMQIKLNRGTFMYAGEATELYVEIILTDKALLETAKYPITHFFHDSFNFCENNCSIFIILIFIPVIQRNEKEVTKFYR